jgi:hypothetical protein
MTELQDVKSRLEIIEMERTEIEGKYEITLAQLNKFEQVLEPV